MTTTYTKETIMNPEIFTNLGIGGATLVIIWFIVKYFMSSLDKKDERLTIKDDYIKGLIVDFQSHVEMCNTNFIKHSQHTVKAMAKQTQTLDTLVKLITDKPIQQQINIKK